MSTQSPTTSELRFLMIDELRHETQKAMLFKLKDMDGLYWIPKAMIQSISYDNESMFIYQSMELTKVEDTRGPAIAGTESLNFSKNLQDEIDEIPF